MKLTLTRTRVVGGTTEWSLEVRHQPSPIQERLSEVEGDLRYCEGRGQGFRAALSAIASDPENVSDIARAMLEG